MERTDYTQKQLVLVLRILVDSASRVPPTHEMSVRIRRVQAGDDILRLVDLGARVGTKHVLWNIGKSRREWLLKYLAAKRPEWRPYGD